MFTIGLSQDKTQKNVKNSSNPAPAIQLFLSPPEMVWSPYLASLQEIEWYIHYIYPKMDGFW